MKNTGKQALRSEQLVLAQLIEKRHSDEQIIIHHVTDTVQFLQLEVERRSKALGITLERIIL